MAEAKFFGPLLCALRRVADVPHQFIRQLRFGIPFSAGSRAQTCSNGVASVLRCSDVFQIFQPIVQFVSVAMIRLQSWWIWPTNRFDYETMDEELMSDSVVAQKKRCIPPAFLYVGAKYQSKSRTNSTTVATHSSNVGDAIEPFVVTDGPPLLCGTVILHQDLPPGVMRQADLTALPLPIVA